MTRVIDVSFEDGSEMDFDLAEQRHPPPMATSQDFSDDEEDIFQDIFPWSFEDAEMSRLSAEMLETMSWQSSSPGCATSGYSNDPHLPAHFKDPYMNYGSNYAAAYASSLRQKARCAELAAATLRQLARSAAEEPRHGAATTLMIKNIPNNYKRENLVSCLDALGFKGKYDFVYLPVDFRRSANLGYAFVNTSTHADAEELKKAFQGFDKWGIRTKKSCVVEYSCHQGGLDLLIMRYRNSPIMSEDVSEECKPALFVNGEKIEFPRPTRKLRPAAYHSYKQSIS
jgi:hypothetical protein